jgi:hypothetical protein
MTITGDVQQKIDVYLDTLRRQLRGLDEPAVREIVAELRSHITDKVAAAGIPAPATVDAALAALGSPQELANEYLTDNLLARAEASRSPVRILESLFHWASLSVAGFFVLVGSILGYFLGIVFVLVAALKPFHPRTAGLWLLPNNTGDLEYSIRLGAGSAPVAGRELLGWWIVPLGLLVGCALVVLTTRFALWCVRQYRRSHLLPRS